MSREKKKGGGLITTLLLLVLLAAMGYCGYMYLQSEGYFGTQEAEIVEYETQTVVHDGVAYFPRQDIRVMLVMGIDKAGPVESSNYYRNNAQADSIMLLIFDETNEVCNVLSLNRDTMLEMDVLGVRGEYAGTAYGQLALAHTYGTGLEDSCGNVKSTLMNYLQGLAVDYYVAMNMDAVSILNDAVGGVKVTVTEDFSAVDPTLTMGEVHLTGDQALTYIRTRKEVGDQLNVTRMKRHMEYVEGFMNLLRTKESSDPQFLVKLFDEVAPYIITDCSVSTLSNMMDRYATYSFGTVVTPEGENTIGTKNGEEHYEFYVDEAKLNELVLDLFYAPKK